VQTQGGFSLGMFLFFEEPVVNLAFAAAMVALYSSLIGLFIYHHPGMDSILAPFLCACPFSAATVVIVIVIGDAHDNARAATSSSPARHSSPSSRVCCAFSEPRSRANTE
jgi:hypothetical protein